MERVGEVGGGASFVFMCRGVVMAVAVVVDEVY